MVDRINDKTSAALKKLQEEQELQQAAQILQGNTFITEEEMRERQAMADEYLAK